MEYRDPSDPRPLLSWSIVCLKCMVRITISAPALYSKPLHQWTHPDNLKSICYILPAIFINKVHYFQCETASDFGWQWSNCHFLANYQVLEVLALPIAFLQRCSCNRNSANQRKYWFVTITLFIVISATSAELSHLYVLVSIFWMRSLVHTWHKLNLNFCFSGASTGRDG